ncbi:unnamed protein product, partial [marine sediment metagenome]
PEVESWIANLEKTLFPRLYQLILKLQSST